MVYSDLRSFLEALAAQGELVKVSVEVDVKYEIGAVARQAHDVGGSEGNKALFFERPKGYNIPIALNVVGNRKRYCMAIDMTPQNFHEQWIERIKKPLEPKIKSQGP